MNKLTRFVLCAAFAGFTLPVSASDEASLSLEPCMNGGVSASGLFPSQAMEDQLSAYAQWVEKDGLALEYATDKLDSRK